MFVFYIGKTLMLMSVKMKSSRVVKDIIHGLLCRHVSTMYICIMFSFLNYVLL